MTQQTNGMPDLNYSEETFRDLYEALKDIPERKSILADAAYTGGDVPKSWIRDRGNWNDGYNQALEDVKLRRMEALAKVEGK